MGDKSFVLLISCWAVRMNGFDIITVETLITIWWSWHVHLLLTDLQSCPLYLYCILSIVIWSGFTVDFACTVLYVLSPACFCLFVGFSALGGFMLISEVLCELSVRAAETIRWERRGETLWKRDRWRGGTDEDPILGGFCFWHHKKKISEGCRSVAFYVGWIFSVFFLPSVKIQWQNPLMALKRRRFENTNACLDRLNGWGFIAQDA